MGLILLHTVTVEVAEDKKVQGAVHWVKRGHYHHMSEFTVLYGKSVPGVQKLLWQPLFSNGPRIDFQVEPVNDEECRVRVECWDIAWPHLKFDLHLLGHAPDNSDVVLTLLLENEQLRRDVDALSAKFDKLQAKLEQSEQQQEEGVGGKARGDSSERDELDNFLLGQSGRGWAARQAELARE